MGNTSSIYNRQLPGETKPERQQQPTSGSGSINNRQLPGRPRPGTSAGGNSSMTGPQSFPGADTGGTSETAGGSGTQPTPSSQPSATGTSSGAAGVMPSGVSAEDAKTANTKSYADLINGQWDAYAQQQTNTIDQRTRQNMLSAQRNYEDSIGSYQKQYRDATTSMYQGMDNAALTADLSGRYGGMASAQVSSIQNAYQKQRQQIALQQQKLATDTAREIEDLRAQGEFDKADALLKARQQQFQQLYEDAVRVDENQYSNWRYDNDNQREDAQRAEAYQREDAQRAEAYQREDAAIEREAQADDKDYLQKLGQSFLSIGVMPSQAMLDAMGISKESAQLYIYAVQAGV